MSLKLPIILLHDDLLQAAKKGDKKAQYFVAHNYTKGKEFFPAEALKWWKKSAKQGYDWAQYTLAGCYGHGWNTKINLKKARELYIKSGKQGNIEAQLALGQAYAEGLIGFKKNKKLSVQWYMKATPFYRYAYEAELETYQENKSQFDKNLEEAKKGNGAAQYRLSLAYEAGKGCEKSKKNSRHWLNEAAANGDREANYLLGQYYMEGKGVKKDIKKGIDYWLSIPAPLPHETWEKWGKVQLKLGKYYGGTHWQEKNGTRTVVSYVDCDKSLAYLERAIEHGCTEAYEYIGHIYYGGRVGEKDIDTALFYFSKGSGKTCQEFIIRCYQKKAQQGDMHAQYEVGRGYHDAYGYPPQDFGAAYKWYLASANQNYVAAQHKIGSFYEGEWGNVIPNYKEALKWYKKASSEDAHSFWLIGSMYERIKKDKKAFKWYLKGARRGNSRCQENVISSYRDGKGVRRSYSKAKKWFILYPGKESRNVKEFNLLLKKCKNRSASAEEYYSLGIKYLMGTGCVENRKYCYQAYKKSADLGWYCGCIQMAGYYREKEDEKKAFKYYKKALETPEDSEVYYWVAYYLIKGETIAHDYEYARSLLKIGLEKAYETDWEERLRLNELLDEIDE